MLICQKCEVEYTDDFGFCPKCGSKLSEIIEEIVDEIPEDLPLLCPHCGATAPAGSIFCQKCGKEIALPMKMVRRFESNIYKDNDSQPNDELKSEEKKKPLNITVILGVILSGMVLIPVIVAFNNQGTGITSNSNYNEMTYTTTAYTTTTAPDYNKYINGIKYLSKFSVHNDFWDYTVNISSFEFTSCSDYWLDSSKYTLECEITGVVNNTTLSSFALDVKCYDSEGYFIDKTTIYGSIENGEKFRLSDYINIPKETKSIEFSG